MQRRVGRRIQNTATSITNANDILPKIKDFLNERYVRIIRGFPFEENLGDTTMTLTASTRAYAMASEIDKIWVIFDQTNGVLIPIKDAQYYVRHRAIDLDQTGNIQVGDPTMCYPVGTYTTKAILAQAEKVTIISDNNAATDKTPACVRIRGLVSGGITAENITLNGTTAVDSSNTYDTTQKLTISSGTTDGTQSAVVGKITVTGKTSTTVLAQIPAGEAGALYNWYEVNPLPKATGTQPTWRIFYGRRLTPLVDNNDIPLIDCCSEMVQGAYVDALKEDGQDWETEEQNWVAQVQELYAAQGVPGRIEQFIPDSQDLIQTLDYGRTIGTD